MQFGIDRLLNESKLQSKLHNKRLALLETQMARSWDAADALYESLRTGLHNLLRELATGCGGGASCAWHARYVKAFGECLESSLWRSEISTADASWDLICEELSI